MKTELNHTYTKEDDLIGVRVLCEGKITWITEKDIDTMKALFQPEKSCKACKKALDGAPYPNLCDCLECRFNPEYRDEFEIDDSHKEPGE